METSLWPDLRQWLKAIVRHWIAIAGGAAVAFIFLIASIWGGSNWLRVLSLVTFFGSFVCATFLAWRDEYRKTIGKGRRLILNDVVELSRRRLTDIGFVADVDPLGALMELSNRIGSEEDVVWVCSELNKHGHRDPFGILDTMLEGGFDGRRLKFLQDARVHSFQIRFTTDAISYVHLWGSQNGLTRQDR